MLRFNWRAISTRSYLNLSLSALFILAAVTCPWLPASGIVVFGSVLALLIATPSRSKAKAAKATGGSVDTSDWYAGWKVQTHEPVK